MAKAEKPSDEQPVPELNKSYGHGMVMAGGLIGRYVVVPPDSPFLPKIEGEDEREQVARYDEDTIVVSSGVPTIPRKQGDSGEARPTQSDLVRTFLVNEWISTGNGSLDVKPTSLTMQEAIWQSQRRQLGDDQQKMF